MQTNAELESIINNLSTEDQVHVVSLALEKKKIAMRLALVGQEINGFTIAKKEGKYTSYLLAHKTYEKNKWKSTHIPIQYLDKEKIAMYLEAVEKGWKNQLTK